MIFRKNEYSALDAAIEAAQRFWAGILCNTRVYSLAVTSADGAIEESVGSHPEDWSAIRGDESTRSYLQAPIMSGNETVATLQIVAEPAKPDPVSSILHTLLSFIL